MKVVSLPFDVNPYQELLHQQLRSRGCTVVYGGCLTASRTLNLILLPIELAARRLAGFRLLHVHWVHWFCPSWARGRASRRFARVWFTVCLRVATDLGYRLVWTAHNAMPHSQVFDDDRLGRRTLIRAASAVIVHNRAGADAVSALGGSTTPLVREIPHGSYAGVYPSSAAGLGRAQFRARYGVEQDERLLLFFGQIQPYKGVPELLDAFAHSSVRRRCRLVIAGRAPESDHPRLQELAAQSDGRVVLRLEHVPEGDVAALFEAADVVVLPFRRVTTSGSVHLALTFGRPLLLPDLPELCDVPRAAALWYTPGEDGLIRALEAVAALSDARLQQLRDAASAHAPLSWDEVAMRTEEVYTTALQH